MEKCKLPAAMLAVMLLLAGCSVNETAISKLPENEAEETHDDTKQTVERNGETVTEATLPEELAQIPEDFWEAEPCSLLRMFCSGNWRKLTDGPLSAPGLIFNDSSIHLRMLHSCGGWRIRSSTNDRCSK